MSSKKRSKIIVGCLLLTIGVFYLYNYLYHGIGSCINKKHQSLIKDSQQLFLIFFYYSFKISLNLKWAEILISSAILLLTKLGISILKSSGFIVKVV